MDEKVLKYRKNIARYEINDAFMVYYQTKDLIIRENIFNRYKDRVRDKVLSLNLPEEDEDVEQIAYEFLLHCIDTFNPNNKSVFSNYLNAQFPHIKAKYDNKKIIESISMTDLDIISNDSLEDRLVDIIYNKEILNEIDIILNKCISKKGNSIIKKIYGNDSLKQREICEDINESHQYVSDIKIRLLVYLYLKLIKLYQYYPSNLVLRNLSKKQFSKIDFNELEELIIHKECNTILDSHRLVKYRKDRV